LIALRDKLVQENQTTRHKVDLTYITSRGRWYQVSWKGQLERSGGLATNIGIHFFDLLIWLFGPVRHTELHHSTSSRVAGWCELERADVRWYLSADHQDLPVEATSIGRATHRSIQVDGAEIEFSEGFSDLHTEIYRVSLAGKGFTLQDTRASIELAYDLRHRQVESIYEHYHPLLRTSNA
jgi:UDP-N-acetyl-2-amino-2-deoxyglucuronate dehydrogenase